MDYHATPAYARPMSNSGPPRRRELYIPVPHDLIMRIGLHLADGDEDAKALAGELGECLPTMIAARVGAALDARTPHPPSAP